MAAVLLGSCVKEYRPPAEGEPAALVKLKLGFGDAKARSLLPPGHLNGAVKVAMYLHEGEERFLVFSQTYDAAFASADSAVLETRGVRVRPSPGSGFEVRLAVYWQTQEWEWVTRQYRIPVTRQVRVREYDPVTKQYTTRTDTVTDFVLDTRHERELVTHEHEQGCTAAVAFAPVRDEVFLLDYANSEVVADCTLFAYRQQVREDGTFQLEPVIAGSIQ